MLVIFMDEKEYNKYTAILKHNKGFNDPLKWIEYAKSHDFKKVNAEKINCCPDCRNTNATKIGQYVYYSNLVFLMHCQTCKLIYSDVMLNDETAYQHFDAAYKDNEYFDEGRRQIFLQIARLIKKEAPVCGTILDVGGAKGHLGVIIKTYRPDISITINDFSAKACEYAKLNFNFNTICCPFANLDSIEKYDFLLLIDVLYYECNISKAWDIVSNFTSNGIIIRVPNKLWLIKLIMVLKNLFSSKAQNAIRDSIDLFNPEHLYIFKRSYLKKRLREHGFTKIKVMPSKGLVQNRSMKIVQDIFFFIVWIIYVCTLRRIIITPAQLIYASRT